MYRLLLSLGLTGFMIAACSAQAKPQQVDVAVIRTQVASTVIAENDARTPTEIPTVVLVATSVPSLTDTPEPTDILEPTNTPKPEARAAPTITLTLKYPVPPRRTYKHNYIISEKYDRFTGKTMVMWEADADDAINRPEGALSVAFEYPDETPVPPEFVYFMLISSNDAWEYLDCHSLTLLLDGQPFPLGPTHKGEVREGHVLEWIISGLTPDALLRIVNTKKVEGKLCNVEFELTAQQMDALRDTASRMQP